MDNKYHYKFYNGFKEVEVGEQNMSYLRRRGKQLAEELGVRITLNVLNEYSGRWEYLGVDLPDGTYVNSFGDICKLNEDGRGYTIITKAKDANKK